MVVVTSYIITTLLLNTISIGIYMSKKDVAMTVLGLAFSAWGLWALLAHYGV